MKPSTSANSNLSDLADDKPRGTKLIPFFECLYKAIWNRSDLQEELIYDIAFTSEHFSKLCAKLDTQILDRHSLNYLALDNPVVKQIKESFLLATPPQAADHQLVTVLDIRPLKLDVATPFLESVILVREEYKRWMKMMPRTSRYMFLTGQPGIGKTYFLYYALVLRLLAGLPTLFQSRKSLFVFDNDSVRVQEDFIDLPGLDIWALVDGDAKDAQPADLLLSPFVPNVRVIMASSPKTKDDRTWLNQKSGKAMMMYPWTMQELRVAASFFYPYDITNSRLENSITKFGHSPRVCFAAARGPTEAEDARLKLVAGIRDIDDIPKLLNNTVQGERVPHCVFEVFPKDESRSWEEACVRPVSTYALEELLRYKSIQDANAAYNLYQQIKLMPDAGPLTGHIWERAVHAYFKLNDDERKFRLRGLGPTEDETLTFGSVAFHQCGADHHFEARLGSSANSSAPCYLYPIQRTFEGLDAFALLPFQKCLRFYTLQMTIRANHPTHVSGLQRAQGWLKRGSSLEAHRPTKERPWPIVFVLPQRLADAWQMPQKLLSRRKKSGEDESPGSALGAKRRKTSGAPSKPPVMEDNEHLSSFWADKTCQFVLALKEEQVVPMYARYLQMQPTSGVEVDAKVEVEE